MKISHQVALMPLAMARPGNKVTIERIEAGRALSHRLAEMGLTPGTEVEVCEGRTYGPLLIQSGSTRLVLGQGMGMKILVRER